MPKLLEMAQLSRPLVIALVAVCVLAAAWVFAIQGQLSKSSSTTSTVAAAPASKAPAASASVHKRSSLGNAPGLKGLSHAIQKADGAVSTSQSYNRQLEAKSAEASGEATGARSPSSSTHASSTHAPRTTSASSTAAHATAQQPSSRSSAAAKGIPAHQANVERALHQGKIAVILFWNPKGSDDVAVNQELKLLEAVHHQIRPVANVPRVRKALESSGLELQKPFAAFRASASEVSSFGSITQNVQVGATPTILIVNQSGQTIELNGLQDALSIEQAIDEARNTPA